MISVIHCRFKIFYLFTSLKFHSVGLPIKSIPKLYTKKKKLIGSTNLGGYAFRKSLDVEILLNFIRNA